MRHYYPVVHTATRSSVNADENTAAYWFSEALAGVTRRVARGAGDGRKANNVILFLGDGMSFPTLAAARTMLGQRSGRTGEEEQLFFEEFPTVGVTKVP